MDVWSNYSLEAFIVRGKDWRWNASHMPQGDDMCSYCSCYVDKSHSSLPFNFGDEYYRFKGKPSNEYKGEHMWLTTFKWSGSYQVTDVCFPLWFSHPLLLFPLPLSRLFIESTFIFVFLLFVPWLLSPSFHLSSTCLSVRSLDILLSSVCAFTVLMRICRIDRQSGNSARDPLLNLPKRLTI